jgi:hypothetical protein
MPNLKLPKGATLITENDKSISLPKGAKLVEDKSNNFAQIPTPFPSVINNPTKTIVTEKLNPNINNSVGNIIMGKESEQKKILTPKGNEIPTNPTQALYGAAIKKLTGSVNPQNVDDYQMAEILTNAPKIADNIAKNLFIVANDKNLPYEGPNGKKQQLESLRNEYFGDLLPEKNELSTKLKDLEVQKNIARDVKIRYNNRCVEQGNCKDNEEDFINYNKASERLNEYENLIKNTKESLNSVLKQQQNTQSLFSQLATQANDLTTTIESKPEVLNKKSDIDLLYDIAKYTSDANTIWNPELNKGTLYSFDEAKTKDGQNLKSIFTKDLYSLDLTGKRQFLTDYKGYERVDKEEMLERYENSILKDTFKLDPTSLQKTTYEGLNNYIGITNNTIKEQTKQLDQLKALQKDPKIDQNLLKAEIDKVQTKLNETNTLQKKLTNLGNTYFKDYKNWDEYTKQVEKDEEINGYSWNKLGSDIKYAGVVGLVKPITSTSEALKSLKNSIDPSVSKSEQVSDELYRYNSLKSVKDFYVPEALKGDMVELGTNEDGSFSWEKTQLSPRLIFRGGLKTTAQSIALVYGGEAIGAATGLEALLGRKGAGVISKYFADKIGIIPASNLFMFQDIREQNIDAYLRGEFTDINQVLGNTVAQTTVEGGTEMFFIPEAKLLKSFTKNPIQEIALNQLFKYAVGKEVINPELKLFVKALTQNFIETPLEESFEEVVGNLGNDMLQNYNSKNNVLYNRADNFTAENNLNTIINTTLSMLPTMIGGFVGGGINRIANNYEQTALMDVGANYKQFNEYAESFINNTSNERLKKIVPGFVNKELLLNKIKETNKKLADTYREAAPILENLPKDKDKLDYFTNLLQLKEALNDPKILEENPELIETLQNKVTKTINEVEKLQKDFKDKPIETLAKIFPSVLSTLDFNSRNLPTLSAIIEQLDYYDDVFKDRKGYEKQSEFLQKTKEVLTERIKSLQTTVNKVQENPTEAETLVQTPTLTVQDEENNKLESTEELTPEEEDKLIASEISKPTTFQEAIEYIKIHPEDFLEIDLNTVDNKEQQTILEDVKAHYENKYVQSDKPFDLKQNYLDRIDKAKIEDLPDLIQEIGKDEDVSEFYDDLMDIIEAKQEEKKIITFGDKKLVIGSFIRKSKDGPVYKVNGLSEDGTRLNISTIEKTSPTEIPLSDPNDILEILTPAQAQLYMAELALQNRATARNKQQKENTTDQVDNDIKAKKADIERRRKDSVITEEENPEDFSISFDEETNLWEGSYYYADNNKMNPDKLQRGYDIIRKSSKEELIKEINVKYDAELKALEQSKSNQSESNPALKDVESMAKALENKIEVTRTKDGFVGDFLNNYELIGEGSEHTVYRKKGSNKVVRISEPYSDKSETTFNQRTRDAKLIDEIVGDGSLTLIGYYESENGTKNPIYEQSFQNSKPISEAEVKAHLENIGGIEYGDKYNRGHLFYHNGKWYKINDYSDNFFKDKNGKIVAIDAAIVPISENEINQSRKADSNFDKAVESLLSKQQPTSTTQSEIQAQTEKELTELKNKLNVIKNNLLNTVEELEKQKEEVIELVNIVTSSIESNNGMLGAYNGQPSTLEQIGIAKLEVIELIDEKIKGIEESIKASEKLKKKKEAEHKKDVSNQVKIFTPLSSSSSQQRTDKPSIKGDKVITTQIKVWTKIREILKRGQSPADVGFYATVMNNSLEEEYLFDDVLTALRNKTLSEDKITNGKIVVITNEKGEILYFDTEGNETTKEKGGIPAYQNFRTVANVTNNQPSQEDLKSKGLVEEYKRQLAELQRIRESKEPFTFEIKEITPGFVNNKIVTENKILSDIEGDLTLVFEGQTLFLVENGIKYAVSKKKFEDTDLMATIEALLDLSITEGLPENIISWEDRSALLEKIYNTSIKGGQFRDNNKGTKIIIKLNNKKLSDQESINYIKNAFINILSSNLNNGNTFSFPKFENGRFEMVEYPNYKTFISKYITATIPQVDNSVAYLKLGEPVIQEKTEEPKEEKPTDLPNKYTLKLESKSKSKGKTALDIVEESEEKKEFKRSILLVNNTTPEQNRIALEWFNEYFKESGVKFNDLRDVVNSEAFATWAQGAINLWNKGKYTDLYHEAFHDFSQMFLSKEQKIALYNEAENTTEGKKALEKALKNKQEKTKNKNAELTALEKYHALEELLAEDFYKYMLSGQKLILNQRVKRNTIFRKIYNFLKELFTGKTDIQTIYKRLATNNISKYERDASKSLFGNLNKNIENFTLEDSLNIYKALDGIIASLFRQKNLSIVNLFKDKRYLDAVLIDVFDILLDNINDPESGFATLLTNAEITYETASEEDKENYKAELAQLQKIVQNVSLVLENWDSVKNSYLKYSPFLKVSSEYLPEDIDSDEASLTKDSRYDDQENLNSIAKSSKQLIYLIASLPAYTNVNGKKEFKMNSFLPIAVDTVDFELTFNQISSALSGLYHYEDQYNKLVSMQKNNPELTDLIQSLPNPKENLTQAQAQIRNQFINIFSLPIVPVKIVTVENNGKEIRVNTYNATSNIVSKLKADWDLNLQFDSPYVIKNPSTTQNELNLSKVLQDFSLINSKTFKDSMSESKQIEYAAKFLNAIGFKLSPQTINSEEFKDYLNTKSTNDGVQAIYNSLSQIEHIRKEEILNKTYAYSRSEKEWANRPIRSVLDMISKDKRGSEENSMNKDYAPVIVKGLLDSSLSKLSEIELKYSEKFYSDSVKNAGGELVWTKRPWNQLSVIYNIINDVERYPTYQDLINSPLGYIFDVNKNPDANNIYLRAVFNLETGVRRKTPKGKYVTLSLYNHNGVNVIGVNSNNIGDKTIKLTRFDKFVQDFVSLLTSGNKEHARYGDKTTSNGTETTFSRYDNSFKDTHLPVDVLSFKTSVLPEEAWKVFEASLNSAITRTNQFHVDNIGKNFDNYSKNLSSKENGGKEEYFGFFEGILSEETKKKFLDKGLLTEENFDAKTITESLKESIKKDLITFLNKEVTKTKTELNSNNLLDMEDYMDSYLLKIAENNKETLLRAFAVNAYILNMEHIRLVFADPRFYDNKNESYTEIFKRMAKASSTGNIGTNDEQINKFLQGTRLETIKYNETHENKIPEKAENGVENTVIFKDIVMTATDFIDQVDERFKNAPLEERVSIKKAYSDAKTTDAFGFCTFDWYRQWVIRNGNDNWNKEKQLIYEKIVNKESLSEEETLKSFAFFPPLKIRVVGFTQNEQGIPIPIDYKFAVSPLVGSIVEGKAFEQVKDNMIRQNVSIGTFKSASKHSSILNDQGTHNNFYNEDGSINESDYTLNPIHTEFIFEVMPSPEDYKGYVSFSTQLRKLLFVNSFESGVPIDYKGTKEQWENLSESKKRSNSSIYSRKQVFSESIDAIIDLEKTKLLEKIDAKLENGKYVYDEEKFSELLQEEFDKRNLPQNALESLKVVNGKFKYSLDSSIQRNTIESIIIAIVDNKLRKQKGFGESLIQASSVGFESTTFERVDSWKSINGNDLPFYGYEGRTLPDGTKVTSAQKMKIALQGDFKKLLNLKDVKNLSYNPEIIEEARQKGGTWTPELVALNRLIKDEKWLDKNNHRELVSTTGVRIPVQGHNSMEFMEVYEFLPEEAGPIVIVSPMLVAKSGGDFDWDKITTLFPSIHYNSYTNKVSLYNVKDSLGKKTLDFKKISKKNKQKTEKLNTFKTELKTALEEYKKDRDFAKLAKQDLKRSSRLINIEIALLQQQYDTLHDLSVQYKEGEVGNIDVLIEAITGEQVVFFETSFSTIIEKIEEKIEEYQKINKVLIPIMERSLTSTSEELAYTRNQLNVLNKQVEEIRKINGDIQDFVFQNNPKKAYNNQINNIIRQTLESTSNFEQLITPNSTDMFEGIADNIQEYKEQGVKKSYSDIPSNTTSLNQFESNTVGKDSLGIGAVWNVFFSQLQEAGMVLNSTYITNLEHNTVRTYNNRLPHNQIAGKTSVSGIYSQEYKGSRYKISEAISQLMNGWVDVAKKDWIFFINGIKEIAPVMLYSLTTGIHKDVAVSFFNQPVLHDFIKNQKNYTSKFLNLKNKELSKNKKAKAIYDTLMKYLPNDLEMTIQKGKKTFQVNAKDHLTQSFKNSISFYATLGKDFRNLANDHQKLFDPNYFEKFAIPTKDDSGKLTLFLPTTREEKLAQALYLIQFLEYQEHGNIFNKLRTSINQDSSKPSNLQAVINKTLQRKEVQEQDLFDSKALYHIVNNSVVKGFTKDFGGINDFISSLSEDMFDITNHPVFNEFLRKEWAKPSQTTIDFNKQVTEGNNIPFETKYEIYDDWVKAIKNDFILYLYQNYVYRDNRRVGSLFFTKWSKWDTAFASELDSIKLNFPELVENNLLLQFLQRDDSLRKNSNNKPETISLKLKKAQLESDTIDILSNSFKELLNFYDNRYTLEQQEEIRNFAEKLADFSFVQSGLSKTPYSFSNIIPNDIYANKINSIIQAFKDLMEEDVKNSTQKATREIQRFNDRFKENNSKFFTAYPIENTNDMDLSFATNDTSRGKNYLIADIIDLLDLNKSANERIAQEENEKLLSYVQSHSSTDTQPWDKETAKNNKNNLYIYESNKSNSGMYGTAIVKGDNRNPEDNTIGITLMEKAGKDKDAFLSDVNLTANMLFIDNSIKDILTLIKKRKEEKKPFRNILFPLNGIVEVSFLKENAPQTYNYLINKLNDTFGTNYLTTENTKFESDQEDIQQDIQEYNSIEAEYEDYSYGDYNPYEENQPTQSQETQSDVNTEINNSKVDENNQSIDNNTNQILTDFYNNLTPEEKNKLGSLETIIETYENMPINMPIEQYIEQLNCKK